MTLRQNPVVLPSLQQDLMKLEAWEKKWGMEFHPDKCNIMSLTRKKTPFRHLYTLKGQRLQAINSTKYLGVDVQSNLSWNDHINRVTMKANSMLGFIRRNLGTAKDLAYNTLVRSGLDYCASVWSPHQDNMTRKIEMVQRRAARFVTRRYRNTSSVTDMLNHLQWETLEDRRSKQQLTLMYKIVNGLAEVSHNHLRPSKSGTRSTHSSKFSHYQSKTNTHKFSFFPRVVPVWNGLAASIVEAQSLAMFKGGLAASAI